ncbi:Cleavage and polyadenylation specificity factor subunit 3, partial [Clonorchis sinensis]
AMPPEGSTRAGILLGCPSLDRRSRDTEVGSEPRTFRSARALVPIIRSDIRSTKTVSYLSQWLERELTGRKVRGSNPASASRLPLSRLAQPGSIPVLMLPSGGMVARHRKCITAERLLSQWQVRLLKPVCIFPWGEIAQRLERERTDRKVRGSNPASASRLPLSRLGKPGSIPALMLPSGGMAARHRKGATAERFIHSFGDKYQGQVSIEHFDDSGPCVVMASPGMMQSGMSRELFENWCTDRRNGVIIAGYCVEGTLAKQILSLPAEIPTMSGQTLPLKCSVDYISFSAHTDYQQTSAFIRELKPNYVILVHGEQNEMLRLAGALQREYEDDDTCCLELFTPKNCVPVNLRFRGEKVAKVLGSLARNPPKNNQSISGVLVKKNFAYHILTPEELPTYTELATTTVNQLISIPFTGSATLLRFHLSLLAGTVEVVLHKPETVQFRVFDSINVTWRPQQVNLEWKSNPTNDMYADAVQNVVLRAAMQGMPPRGLPHLTEPSKKQLHMALEVTLQDAFGMDCLEVEEVEPDAKSILVRVDSHVAEVDLTDLSVSCPTNSKLEHIIRVMVQRVSHCISAV